MPAINKRRVLLLLLLLRRSKKVRKIFQIRSAKGEYHALITEMKLSDHESFYRYFHMTPQRFSHLLSLVGPSL